MLKRPSEPEMVMSLYRDVERLAELTLKLSPGVERSKLWRRARDKALAAAKRDDREQDDFSYLKPAQPMSEDDEHEYQEGQLEESLEAILGRPLRYSSKKNE